MAILTAITLPTGSRPRLSEVIETHANNFNLVRLIAASSVIYFHSFALSRTATGTDEISQVFWPTANLGNIAVGAFFVASGLFVTQSYFKDRSVAIFVIKRFFRIWPGLFVCLALTAALAAIFSKAGIGAYLIDPAFHSYIIRNSVLDLSWYIPGIFDDHPNRAINGSIHTLVPETRLYMVLAVLALLGVLDRRITIGMAAAGICLYTAAGGQSLQALIGVPAQHSIYIFSFFLGVLIFSVSSLIPSASWIYLLPIIVVPFATEQIKPFLFFIALSGVVIFAGCTTIGGRHVVLKNDYSYGMYIYGFPVQQLVVHFVPNIGPNALTVVALLATFGFAYFSWHCVEKPAQASGKRLIQKWQGRPGRMAFYLPRVETLRRNGLIIGLFSAMLTMTAAAYGLSRLSLLTVSQSESQISGWGPKTIIVGTPFNADSKGRSAIWIKVDGMIGSDVKIRFGEAVLTAQANKNGTVTAYVPEYLVVQPRSVLVAVERHLGGRIERTEAVPVKIVDP